MLRCCQLPLSLMRVPTTKGKIIKRRHSERIRRGNQYHTWPLSHSISDFMVTLRMTMMMTTTTTVTVSSLRSCQLLFSVSGSCCTSSQAIANANARSRLSTTSLQVSNPTCSTTLTRFNTTISALNSGLQASITDSKSNSATLKNAQIVVESEDGIKLQLRVDLTGDQTQMVFDQILSNLARTAPPIPGFRRQKGGNKLLYGEIGIIHYHTLGVSAIGKTSKVPKSFLIQMLGEERVTKFVIQEILNTTMADYVKKVNLDVKDQKISTTQTAEELKQSFQPGNVFGFNVVIEPESS